MKRPPTWRALAARAHKLGLTMQHGRHEASLLGPSASIDCRFVSWTHFDSIDARILRSAVAAALGQLEDRQ